MSWPTLPLRRQFRVVNGGTPHSDSSNWNGAVPWATPVDLGRADGAALAGTERTLSEQGLVRGSRAVPPGSLVVSTRAPIGYVVETVSRMAFNQGCRGLIPRRVMSVTYFRYQLHALADRLAALGQGSTFLELSADSLASVPLVVPPFATQNAIVDYLDRESALIDPLISAKRRMVRLLEQRLWLAFIGRVIDSNPKATPLRRTFHSLIDGPFGSAFSSSDYSDEGAAVVRLGNIGFSQYRSRDQARIPMALYETFIPYRVVEGDLLIAGLGDDRNHPGRACVAPDLGPAIVKGKCFRARVDDSRASADFLSLLLSSPLGAEAMDASGRGSTRSMINLEIVKGTEIPLPDRGVQDWLVEDTRADQARTSQMMDVLNRQIALLQEHRQALITAAVTGQLEIPEAA